ncbi:hypothetical protein LguiA_030425 [Lonicera macranthoides]
MTSAVSAGTLLASKKAMDTVAPVYTTVNVSTLFNHVKAFLSNLVQLKFSRSDPDKVCEDDTCNGMSIFIENCVAIKSLDVAIYGCTGTTMSLLVAVVNPNKQAVEKWDATNDISREFNSLCNNSEGKEYIL